MPLKSGGGSVLTLSHGRNSRPGGAPMQFVRTIIWIAVAVIVALFAIRNGAPVTVNLWSDLQMVTPLWVIVVLSFLTGLLPLLAKIGRASGRERVCQYV